MATKEEFQKSFGENVRRIRNGRSLTLEQLALEAGISYSQVSRIELGKRNPSGYTIYILSKTLDVCPSKFFEFTNFKGQNKEML